MHLGDMSGSHDESLHVSFLCMKMNHCPSNFIIVDAVTLVEIGADAQV